MHVKGSALLFIVAALLLAWARADAAVRETCVSFPSGGKMIVVDRFAPVSGRGRAAVLILYGAGGIYMDGPEMHRVARRLAEGGDEAYVVHYFNRTGTMFGLDKNMQTHFEEWVLTVRDAVAWVHAQHDGHAPVGIFGYSLGAFLTVAAASDDPRVGAIVEHAGGIWNNQASRLGRLPPTLMIHGLKDQRVPAPKYAAPLLTAVKKHARHWRTDHYPQEAHVFNPAANAQVREQTAAWFARWLPSSRLKRTTVTD